MNTFMKMIAAMGSLIMVNTITGAAFAVEVTTGQLTLVNTVEKTVGTPGEIISLPKCPTRVNLFTPANTTCAPVAPDTTCTVETTVSSELSDVTPGPDSVRFYLSVDNIFTGVLPNSNVGVKATAKAGLIETGGMAWMKNNLTPGTHSIKVQACVADTDNNGSASAFGGDRIAVIRVYSGS